jgi:trk system potassium uptake protein TrkH
MKSFNDYAFKSNIHLFMKSRSFWTPSRLTAFMFLAAILIGSVLLVQPWSTIGDLPASFVDAFFTASSAVCVTGLIVQDTPNFFSPVGLTVILLLIQAGGLSIMTLSAALPVIFGKSLHVGQRDLISGYLDLSGYVDESGYVKLLFILKKIIKYTLVFELVGACILTLRWYTLWGNFGKAAWYGLFHSVSAFCNAGFALFSNNMESFRDDPVINFVVMALGFFGGLGFLVIYDIFSPKKFREYSFHSKLVLSVSGILILLPSLFIFFAEFSHAFLDFSMMEKIFAALFHPVVGCKAGFNTYDMNMLGNPSLFLIGILMFIGGAPGATAGGIKVSTLGILFLSIRSVVLGREQIEVFGRRVTQSLVTKSIAIVAVYSLAQVLSIILLLFTEEASFRDIVFESISAIGTVGLSLGVTSDLSFWGKVVVSFSMIFGRVGPLMTVFLMGSKQEKVYYRFPEGNAMVG